MLAVFMNRVVGLDERNNVFEQVILKRRPPALPRRRTAACAGTTRASAFTRGRAAGVGCYGGIAIWKDEDQRLNLAVGEQVVDHISSVACLQPFAVVAADAM